MARIKEWEELTISDNFLFQKVMQNKRLCKRLIQKLLKIKIKNIIYPFAEKSIAIGATSKAVRLDLYVETDDGTIIDIEIQTTDGADGWLPKRTRYYQAMIDLDVLGKGKDYIELKKSYVIFICTFDPYGKGLPIYHFTYCCHEDDGLQMGDLTENIFLNATAADRTEDRELAAFLRYVDNGLAGNRFTQELDEETKRVKNDKDWRERIVTWEMDLRIMEKAAEERGRKEGRR